MSAYQPSYDLSAVLRGPAHLFITDADSGAIWGTSCSITPEESTFAIAVAGFGAIDQRRADLVLKIACEGAGRITPEIVSFLWGFGGLRIGQALPMRSVWVKALDGTIYKIENAFVSQPPSLILGANSATYGAFEVTGILKNATAREVPNSLYTRSTAAFTALPSPDEVPSLPVQASWATTPATAIQHQSAWTIDFGLELETKAPVDVGTIGAFVTGLSATAKCTPFGLGESLLERLALQGTGAGIGKSRPGYDLTLAQDHPGLTVTLKNAKLAAFPLHFAESGQDRIGEIAFTAFRGAGASTLFSIAQTAAE